LASRVCCINSQRKNVCPPVLMSCCMQSASPDLTLHQLPTQPFVHCLPVACCVHLSNQSFLIHHIQSVLSSEHVLLRYTTRRSSSKSGTLVCTGSIQPTICNTQSGFLQHCHYCSTALALLCCNARRLSCASAIDSNLVFVCCLIDQLVKSDSEP
jgi:hypothetical protein